jgi:CRISPR/Cas system-associated exonuclease Cas4 (RecB family)
MGKKQIDPEHINQVICYCLCLELDKVLMLYEDRDVCTLYCPPVVKITESMKQNVEKLLLQTEEMVENHFIPKMVSNPSICKWCKYKGQCEKDGE